ncbi:MAG: hypothetical protein M3O50_19255, partial [Myxococcota bacterium]|nr:hypothetical protein [Myxococcota bacterium]
MSATEVPASSPESALPWAASSRVSWQRVVPGVASVAYVAVLAVSADGAREPRGFLCGGLAVLLALASARRVTGLERAIGWGAALVLASLGVVSQHRGLDAFGAMGAMTSAGAAAIAIGRIQSQGGIAQVRALSPVLSVLVVGAAWAIALLARFAPEAGPLGWIVGNRHLADVAAAAASALVLLAATDWTLRRRRLELGVEERAHAMRAIIAGCLVVAVIAGFLCPTELPSIGRGFVAVTASLLGAAALHADAVKVARCTRRALCLLAVGGATAWLGAMVGASSSEGAWLATVATAGVSLAAGAAVAILDRPLRPAGGVWLDAFARAGVAACSGDADVALRDALVALRAPAGAGAASPELWTLAPPCVATVDAAGYLHEREGDLPEMLAAVAAAEPQGTLRAEVLDSLEVRRPDLRSLAAWLSARAGWLATVIASEGELDGVLVLRRAGREPPTTLEELRALRVVADRLAAPCRTRAMQGRLLARAHEMLLRAGRAESALGRLGHE